MFCRNCGKQIADQAIMCVGCGVPPHKGRYFCQNCAAPTNPIAEMCVQCGMRLSAYPGPGKDWLTALLLCLFVGVLGIHRFYTGHTLIGFIQLFTGGCCGIWTFIDFIMIVVGSYRDKEGNLLVKR